MTAQDYVRTASFDLSVPSDSGKEVSGVLATPPGMGHDSALCASLHRPFQCIYGVDSPTERHAFLGSSGGNGTFMIVVSFFRTTTILWAWARIWAVSCVVEMTMELTIPQSQFQSYPSGTALV